ncbi:hypothetical protein [Bifidobacterium leontopitheci]|uniref:Lipoprotein n=1 Tax=Bifidobacterium leontopitheci TaxID=2650774 RepID=A0A6I1GKY4_9BIFI|nr:hypothetical protein [Bifidobacterium leontopitheci]KAB7791452.1 hypothetical protein F7D09_0127 [Bifidobacterium leontopitheci]
MNNRTTATRLRLLATFIAALIAAICLLLAGCAGGTDKQQTEQQTIQTYTSVAAIIKANPKAGTTVRIKSTLVTKDGTPYLCDYTLESDPPQPSSPNIAVAGLPLDKLSLRESKGVKIGDADAIVKLTSAIDPDGTTKAEFVRLP